jgi:hypothetical protein
MASGAASRPTPFGSVTEIVPLPEAPFGALANHGRPKPLLKEMPSGRLTDGRSFVIAPGLSRPFRNAGVCALYSITRPSTVAAAGDVGVTTTVGLIAAAKSSGTTTRPLETSSDRIDPGASRGRASGAPKFDELATKSRAGSRTRPGCVNGANPAANGPPL